MSIKSTVEIYLSDNNMNYVNVFYDYYDMIFGKPHYYINNKKEKLFLRHCKRLYLQNTNYYDRIQLLGFLIPLRCIRNDN